LKLRGRRRRLLDDEPLGRTSSRGRLRLSSLVPAEHDVRISLRRYVDHEERIEIPPQQTLRLVVKLETAPRPQPARTAKEEIAAAGISSCTERASGAGESGHIPVAHHQRQNGRSLCLGWLGVGDDVVQYRAEDNVHIFNFPLRLIKEVKKNGVYMPTRGVSDSPKTERTTILSRSKFRRAGLTGRGAPLQSLAPPEPVLAAIAKVFQQQ